jgi:hypothetical protein
MRLTLNGGIFTRTILSVDNSLNLYNSKNKRTTGGFTLSKKAAVVDTLIAEKSGFTTKKVPIDSYTKPDVVIALDSAAAGGKCTREALQAVGEAYVMALEDGDPTQLDLAANAKYFENMTTCKLDSGIWKTKLRIDYHRTFIDVDSCKIFVELIDSKSSTPWEIGAQITLKDGRITIINALAVTVGDWALNNKSGFTFRETVMTGRKLGQCTGGAI